MKNFFTQKATLLLFLLFCPFFSKAQFDKQVVIETETGDQEEVYFLTAADFTNDSIPEIIGKSFYSDNIYMLTQKAGGVSRRGTAPNSSYGNGKIISHKGANWSFLKTGDLDGDNFTDLIIYQDDGQTQWMQNDKKGGFSEIKVLFTDDNAKFLHPEDLIITDIDGDGKDDIVARLPGNIAWYHSEGNTVSGKQTLLAVEDKKVGLFEKGQLAISDVNPGGYRELALLADGTLYIANNTSGTFTWDQTLASDTLQAGYITWADLDQDGYQDLIATDTYSWTGIYHLWYYDHNQSGQLNTKAQALGQTFLNSATMQYIWSVFPEDIDQDDDMDIFIQLRPEGCDPASKTSVIGWLENQNSWSATVFHEITTEEVVAFADLDNDSDTDLILKHNIGEASQWLKNEQSSFEEKRLTEPRGIQGSIKQAILADIDQDTYQDVALTVGSDVVWLRGQGRPRFPAGTMPPKGKQDNTFAAPSVIKSLAGLPGSFLEAGNINQDKSLELILSYKGVNGFNYVACVGIDTTTSFMSTQISRDEYPVFTGDVDQDGDLDILTAISEDEYAWFENREGIFKDYWRLGKVSTGTRLTGVMDIDGDRDLDILTDDIWFENQGNGSFRKNKSEGGEWAADIDGDGDLDLLRNTSSGLQWYEQTSPGEFDQLKDLIYKTGNFAVADVDGDGDPDIITFNKHIILWENNEGSFTQAMVIDEVEVKTLAFAHADHDTDLDIIATTENKVLFYRNLLRKPPPAPPQDILLSDTTIAENMPAGTVVAEINGQDINNPLTFQLVNGEGSDDNASFEVKGEQLLTTVSFDYETKEQYAIRLQATDTSGLSLQKMFVIQVTDIPENNAPTVSHSIDDQSVLVEKPYEYTIPDDVFTDADASDSLAYHAMLASGNALPAWLNFDAVEKSLSGIPQTPDTLNITIIATDREGATAADTFTLIVKAKGNSSPILQNPIADQNIVAGETYQWTIPENTFTDADEDILKITASSIDNEQLPSWLSFDAETLTFSGTPNQADTISIVLTATDTENETVSDVFYLFVEEKEQAVENHAPTVSNAISAQTILVGQHFEMVIPEDAFTDEDADDKLTYAVTLVGSDDLLPWLTFDAQTKKLSGTAPQADSLSLLITAQDTQGASASQTFTLLIKDENKVTSIDDPDTQHMVHIYPNPVAHYQQLYFESNRVPSEKVSYTIWSIEGKVMQKGALNFYNNRPVTIELKNVKAGIYMVEIDSDSSKVRKRIIVQ